MLQALLRPACGPALSRMCSSAVHSPRFRFLAESVGISENVISHWRDTSRLQGLHRSSTEHTDGWASTAAFLEDRVKCRLKVAVRRHPEIIDTSVSTLVDGCTSLSRAGFTEEQIATLATAVPALIADPGTTQAAQLVLDWLQRKGIPHGAVLERGGQSAGLLLLSPEQLDRREQTWRSVGLDDDAISLLLGTFLHRCSFVPYS